MDIILLHGLAKTPLSMLPLAWRLRQHGHRPHLLAYLPATQSLEQVCARLVQRVHLRVHGSPYALVGHSLGSVIIRKALTHLAAVPPSACFLLAPPLVASRSARYFSRYWLYRQLFGEMGMLLADPAFMDALPMPAHTTIFASTGGPRRDWLPFGHELNDGLLLLTEMSPAIPVEQIVLVPALHSWIMNKPQVAEVIARRLAAS